MFQLCTAQGPALERQLGPLALSCTTHLANSCRQHRFFSVALELLLYNSIPGVQPRGYPSAPVVGREDHTRDDSLLSWVVEVLKALPEFLDVVVQCARKTEATLWQHLFFYCGQPADLLSQCLQLGKCETASHYLLLVQRSHGIAVARQFAVRCVVACICCSGFQHLTHRILNRALTDSTEENMSLTKSITFFLQAHVE